MKRETIHIGNYEAYLLDQAEGNLSPEMAYALQVFLAAHSELAVDPNEIASLSFAEENIVFNAKQQLKRSEADLVTEPMLVAYIEGQLSPQDQAHVEKSVANNVALQHELALYKKTILVPDLDVVYEPKSELKRRPKVIWFNPSYTRYAAAAALLLLLGLIVVWFNNSPNNQGLAHNTTTDTTTHHAQAPVQVANTTASSIPQPEQQHTDIAKQEVSQPQVAQKSTQGRQAPQPVQPQTPGIKTQEAPLMANEGHTNTTQPVHPEEKIMEQPVQQLPQESQPVAVNGSKPQNTVVTVVEEGTDDADAMSKKKNNLWALAGKALKKLNKAGVKAVDGDEKDRSQSTAYTLTLGGFHVYHSQNGEEK